jgi:hypothetical protein
MAQLAEHLQVQGPKFKDQEKSLAGRRAQVVEHLAIKRGLEFKSLYWKKKNF